MAHRTPKINDTVKFTDQQQAILNDAVEQLMEAGGLTALTQAHFNEAMKIVAQRFINQRRPARGTEAPFDTGRRKSQSAALDTATCTVGAVAPAVCFSTTRESSCLASSDRNAEALASKVVRSGRRAACSLAAGSSKPSCAPFLTRCASSISSLSNRRQPSTAAKNRCMVKARTGS